MGEVYLAHAHGASGFSRKIAIKILAAELTGDASLEAMLIREAVIGGMIHHRNVMAVLGLGVDEGTYYLITEYVDGGDLDPYLEAGALPEPLALHVAHEIALGLAHLHAACDERGLPLRIVHRDVRPGNVLVSTTGDVKLADFGVAKVTARVNYTASGVRKGQVRYLAPELVAGETATAASDQFAFAITLAELLTGHRPYPDGKPWQLAAILRAGPNLDGITEDLRAILTTALAIDPAERFPSVEAMRLALADAQATRPRCGAPEVAAWVRLR
jgi:serine/threonine-protein kinase